jgi:hypothetical protein
VGFCISKIILIFGINIFYISFSLSFPCPSINQRLGEGHVAAWLAPPLLLLAKVLCV